MDISAPSSTFTTRLKPSDVEEGRGWIGMDNSL
jgi:hypothetical protein